MVPNELALDVSWFPEFTEATNGLVLPPPQDKKTWVIECDPSLQAGGAHSPAARYSKAVLDQGYNIAQLEAINLVTALRNLAPPKAHEYSIIINTDNMTSQQAFSSGAGRDPVICACARQIWLIAAELSTEVVNTQIW